MLKRKIVVLLTVLALLMPMSASAASGTVKMKTYDDVIKSGNTVFCSGSAGLYKVKMNGNKVKSVKRLQKINNPSLQGINYMKKKGKYLYYVLDSSSVYFREFYRIRIDGKKKKKLASRGPIVGYVIKGKKIYYTEDHDDYLKKRVMKLNGKKKKKTNVEAVLIMKKSNKKGYSIIQNEKAGYYYDYLKTPAGMFLLGKTAVN